MNNFGVCNIEIPRIIQLCCDGVSYNIALCEMHKSEETSPKICFYLDSAIDLWNDEHCKNAAPLNAISSGTVFIFYFIFRWESIRHIILCKSNIETSIFTFFILDRHVNARIKSLEMMHERWVMNVVESKIYAIRVHVILLISVRDGNITICVRNIERALRLPSWCTLGCIIVQETGKLQKPDKIRLCTVYAHRRNCEICSTGCFHSMQSPYASISC